VDISALLVQQGLYIVLYCAVEAREAGAVLLSNHLDLSSACSFHVLHIVYSICMPSALDSKIGVAESKATDRILLALSVFLSTCNRYISTL
jgi:hypothetical protein